MQAAREDATILPAIFNVYCVTIPEKCMYLSPKFLKVPICLSHVFVSKTDFPWTWKDLQLTKSLKEAPYMFFIYLLLLENMNG